MYPEPQEKEGASILEVVQQAKPDVIIGISKYFSILKWTMHNVN